MHYADKLAHCFRDVWQLQDKDVTLNKPFSGGFITRTYGSHCENETLKNRLSTVDSRFSSLPWLQIEISRALYLRPPWFDPQALTISKHRVGELNATLWEVLQSFWRRING
jgi:formiminoglutamase